MTVEGSDPIHRVGSNYNRALGMESMITSGWLAFQDQAVMLLNDDQMLDDVRFRTNEALRSTNFWGQEAVENYCQQIYRWVEKYSPCTPSREETK